MLIDQYADVYRQATSGAGKGAKYADFRMYFDAEGWSALADSLQKMDGKQVASC